MRFNTVHIPAFFKLSSFLGNLTYHHRLHPPSPITMKTSIIDWPCLIDDTTTTHLDNNAPKTNKTSHLNTHPNTTKTRDHKTGGSSVQDGPKHIDSIPKPSQNALKHTKTFAQALSNLCDIPTSQFPQPILKGDNFSISIPEEEYDAGMIACKHNLHARIIWAKGSIPLTVFALKQKLSTMWKDLERWGVTSLGKGFYEFTFTRLEDVKRVRSIASWNLSPGILKLFTWTKDFNSSVQNSTSAQVWVRIHGLAQEYWRPRILFAIASSVGTPICTDAASTKPMIERTFGHFARVLVDMDVSQEPRYKVLVERKDYAFFVDFEFENMPDFCSYCKKVGHYVDICKHANKPLETNNMEKQTKSKHNSKSEYVVMKDGRQEQGNKQDNPIIVEETKEAGPSKHQKSPQIPNKVVTSERQGKEQSAQGNKFDALMRNDGDQEENIRNTMKNTDLQLEQEVNAELEASHSKNIETDEEDTNSHTSEFVDATQQNDDANMDEETSEEHTADVNDANLIIDHEKRKVLDKQNRDFLDKSWANIIENEAAEDRLLKDIEVEDSSQIEQPANIDDFQVVLKNKKKGTLRNPVLRSYSTRAKASNPRPFK